MGDTLLQTDFLFDGDGATVQRAKSKDGTTGRDVVSIETAELCARKDPWATLYAGIVRVGDQ